ASEGEAADAIGGYTICNDVSMRDWQWRTSEWLQGKTWEGSTPLGPALVTPDEVDHASDLLLRCEVDGEVMQEARTSDLLFKPADIVRYVSTIVTLEPGDVFSTGTAGGSAAARRRIVDDLFGRATADEADFLRRLLIGDLRQGALEGVMTDAIAKASRVPVAAVRRAAMLAGDLCRVAADALHGGEEALSALGLEVLRPVGPMLAAASP